ncbi:hypothetical protein LX87_04463 [Larkinella arboricola]|uniref:N-acetyltransferase domain-containing protein n=1 Tax=Larkinella arboricola TaxID=643671 RepID=A0A327WRK7_LARAB|nr:GNAT family N-acetyltransferase [Larkinella arboricola]RAJ94576.1 hypothetical protein LX87_04463 [Larkinella arboricola]
MKTQEVAVLIDRAESRFELEIEGKLSFISYIPKDDRTLIFIHTEVHPNLQAKGVGAQLIKGAFEYVDTYNLKVIPACSFVATYIRRHPEYNRLVSPAYL